MPRHPLYQAAYQAADRLVRHNHYLGFTTPTQALIAIVQHGDWQDRWEVEGPDAVAVLETFRAAHLQFFPHWERLLLTLADGSRAASHPEYREAV
tara:strand:+ start:644 stop:928 length:285 start_codon:yes stop_codon:yes gene_type:complete